MFVQFELLLLNCNSFHWVQLSLNLWKDRVKDRDDIYAMNTRRQEDSLSPVFCQKRIIFKNGNKWNCSAENNRSLKVNLWLCVLSNLNPIQKMFKCLEGRPACRGKQKQVYWTAKVLKQQVYNETKLLLKNLSLKCNDYLVLCQTTKSIFSAVNMT